MQSFERNLGDLADPLRFNDALDLSGCSPNLLGKQLDAMLVIRFAEEKLSQMINEGIVRCPCHLGIGQEAIAAGVSESLRPNDRIFGGHRSHSHFLAAGGSVYSLFAEVLGRIDGCSKGMGGSMHLHDKGIGFLGSVPIVAATIPLAVGAALAAKMDGKHSVAVSYFGDGATEEGAFHESLNLASRYGLPILFVCENNLFSSHLHISLRQSSDSVARYAAIHGMATDTIDGNDVIKVTSVAGEMIARCRIGQGPCFLEAVTYRWKGHVGANDDIDVGVRRDKQLALWKQRDPIGRLASAMESRGMLTAAELESMNQRVSAAVDADWERALGSPFPPPSALTDPVYHTGRRR